MKNNEVPVMARDRISSTLARADRVAKPEIEAVSCLFNVSVSDAEEEPAMEEAPASCMFATKDAEESPAADNAPDSSIQADSDADELPPIDEATEKNSPGLSLDVEDPAILASAA
jgi:hypothetical protein